MAYLVLARKYRPQTFDQVVGQEHVTQTLAHAISAGRVAHAILFSGPRGTGKTTIARILAKAMNCEAGPTATPCNRCRSCREITSGSAVDVFEIDGASNNSVDQVRELRENIKYMPAHSPCKIYIIDEVHMLSIAAFNALLKTLEEPPAHVLFFFATTEPHKIPITILSRCQRHDLRRIDMASITAHLAELGVREKIEMPPDSLELIAREADGSMRDAMSLLDQVMSCTEGALEPGRIVDILGVIDRKVIFNLSAAVLAGDLPQVLSILDTVYDRGFDLKKLYADTVDHFRNLLVVKWGQKVDQLVDLPAHEIDLIADQIKAVPGTYLNQIFDILFKEEATIRFASQPKLAFEMIFIRMLLLKPALSIDTLIEKLDQLKNDFPASGSKALFESQAVYEAAGPAPASGPDTARPAEATPATEGSAPIESAGKAPAGPAAAAAAPSGDLWEKVVDRVAREKPSLGSNLARCRMTETSANRLEIEVSGNGFCNNMIQKNAGLLKAVCTRVAGREMEIVIKEKKDAAVSEPSARKQADSLKKGALNHPLVADAVEIFNGTLVDVKKL